MPRLRGLVILISGLVVLVPAAAQAVVGVGMLHTRTPVMAIGHGQIAPAAGLEMVAESKQGVWGVYSMATGALIAPLLAPFDSQLDQCYLQDFDGDGYDDLLCIQVNHGAGNTTFGVQRFQGGSMVSAFPAGALAFSAQFVGTMRLNPANPTAMVFTVGDRLYIVGQNGVIKYDSANDASWPIETGATVAAEIGDFMGSGFDQVEASLTPSLGTDKFYEMLIGDLSLPTADAAVAAPIQARLLPSRPNPAAGPVRIGFALPSAAQVQLLVYDAQGRMVSRLANGRMEAGQHESLWDGRDGSGTRVQPGAYFYELVVDGAKETRRLIQLR